MKKLFVLFAAVAFVAVFTLPAAAADDSGWQFYGSARVGSFYEGQSDDIGDIDTDNFNLYLQGNSRIGAKVKHGAVSGRFEYGSGPNLRLLYGAWDFGGGEFIVGQDYTPVHIFVSNQVWGSDNDLLDVGGIYNGRRPQLALKMNNFKIAVMKAQGTDLGTGSDLYEAQLPQIEAAYEIDTDMAHLKFMGGFQSYTADPNGINEDVTSYIAGLAGMFNLGVVTIGFDGFYGLNIGDYGLTQLGATNAVWTGTSLEDTNTMGGVLVATFQASDTVTLEVGGGYSVSENDTYAADDDTMAIYGNAVFTLAPNVMVVPEIGYFDYGDAPAGGSEGEMMYGGAKFQINF